MKNFLVKTRPLLLLVAGALLILVASLILVAPVDFYAANDIELGADPSLLNELKAPAGFLLAAGLFIASAAFARRLADAATLLAAMIYLSYAGSRFASMLLDGMPADGLLQAALLEAVVGLACLALLATDRLPAVGIAGHQAG